VTDKSGSRTPCPYGCGALLLPGEHHSCWAPRTPDLSEIGDWSDRILHSALRTFPWMGGEWRYWIGREARQRVGTVTKNSDARTAGTRIGRPCRDHPTEPADQFHSYNAQRRGLLCWVLSCRWIPAHDPAYRHCIRCGRWQHEGR
jgi:hypothetical protein